MDDNEDYVDGKDVQALTTFKNTYKCENTEDTQTVYSICPQSHLLNNFTTLSEADKEIMDKIVDIFGNYEYEKLSDYTHDFKEWQPFKKSFGARKPINIKDVFEDKIFMNHSKIKGFLSEEIIQSSFIYYMEG